MMKTMNEKLTFGMILAAAMQLASPVRADVRLEAPAQGTRAVTTVDPGGEARVVVRIDVPACDVQEMWMPAWKAPRQERKWRTGEVSAPQCDMPYVGYFNAAGRNSFSIGAASLEWDTEIVSKLNQEKGAWEVAVTVAAGPGGALRPFAVTLDRRTVGWTEALADWRDSLGLAKGTYPEAAWKPVYCSWYAVHAAVTQDWTERTAALAADLGFRTFILDDGWSYDEAKRVNPETLETWYRDTGRWDVFSKRKFPDFRAHRERMRALGLNYLVWVAPYFVGTRSEAFVRGGFGERGLEPSEGAVLADPTDRKFLDSVDGQLVRLLKECDLDGLKIDFLDAVLPSVEKPRGSASLAYMRELMAKLRAVKPNGLFEFRQNYATPLTAPLATQFRAGDVPFEWLANLLNLAQLRVTMGDGVPIHADPIFWSAAETPDNVNRHFLAAMVGVPMLSMDLGKLSDAERATVRRWLAFYAEHVEAFQREGRWQVDYANGGVASVRATLGDAVLLVVNDADRVPRLRWELPSGKRVVLNLTAQTLNFGDGLIVPPAEAAVREGTRWIDASTLTIEGRAFPDGKGPFDRLPASAEGRVTPAVWYFSHHTAGMALRFRTDSDFVKVKWDLLEDALDAPNMSRCGKSGFDVYRRAKDGRWKFVRSFSPQKVGENLGMTGWTRGEEGLIHFPLYNGVRSLLVGVATNASFEVVKTGKKPIVWYGVSTTQGIAASRPGMAFTAIISRRLDVPHVNLGFSGAGQMEMEMCGYVADLEASVYVIDTPGNLNLELMQERYEKFLRELHRRRPDTPIVIADQRIYSSERETRTPMNECLAAMFARLGKEPGWKLFHVRAESMFPKEVDEVSVDSPDGHPSDLGMMQLADAYQRQIAAAMGGSCAKEGRAGNHD